MSNAHETIDNAMLWAITAALSANEMDESHQLVVRLRAARSELLSADKRWRDVAEEQPEEGQNVEAMTVAFLRRETTSIDLGKAYFYAGTGKWHVRGRLSPSAIWLWRPASPTKGGDAK